MYVRFWAAKPSGAVVVVSGGGASAFDITETGWQSFVVTPFGIGEQKVSLLRNNATIVSVPGMLDIEASPKFYDFNFHAPFGVQP